MYYQTYTCTILKKSTQVQIYKISFQQTYYTERVKYLHFKMKVHMSSYNKNERNVFSFYPATHIYTFALQISVQQWLWFLLFIVLYTLTFMHMDIFQLHFKLYTLSMIYIHNILKNCLI